MEKSCRCCLNLLRYWQFHSLSKHYDLLFTTSFFLQGIWLTQLGIFYDISEDTNRKTRLWFDKTIKSYSRKSWFVSALLRGFRTLWWRQPTVYLYSGCKRALKTVNNFNQNLKIEWLSTTLPSGPLWGHSSPFFATFQWM